jgi:HCOMODA/2-hydroxy-3-carboxy-muconic semialdehyde decarboxylase
MQMGTPDFLTPGEVDKCTTTLFSPLGLDRAWEYWRTRAGYGG